MRQFLNSDADTGAKPSGKQWRFGTLLVTACLAVAVGQFWGLQKISALDSQQRAWQADQNQREREATDTQGQVEKFRDDLRKNQQLIEQTKVELAQAQADRDRAVAEQLNAQKQLELTRKAESDAATARQTATQESQAAATTKAAAEKSVKELATQESTLKLAVARLQAEQDQLTKGLATDKATEAKLTVDLDAAKKQLADLEKQIAAARMQLGDLQTGITKGNADLQQAVTEHGKTLRNRETLLADVTAAEQRVANLKKTEDALTLTNKELEKSNQQMATDKTEIDRLKAERVRLAKLVEDEKAAKNKAIDERTTAKQELDDTKKQVEAAQAKLKEVQGDLKKRSDDLIPTITMIAATLGDLQKLKSEVTAAEKLLEESKTEAAALVATKKETQKANQQLSLEKADLATSVSELQTRVGDLQKQITAKTADLTALLKRIKDAEEGAKKSADSKVEKSETKESDKKSTDAKEADKPESSPADGKNSK